MFETIWDGGGLDTYDFSNFTNGVKVDLQPGGWTTTSSAQLARLHWDGSKIAVGNIANALLYQGDGRSLIENANGGAGADTITGNQTLNTLRGNGGTDALYGLGNDDTLIGGAGNDLLDGGDGTDTAGFSGASTGYSWSKNADGSWGISGADGTDTLWRVEKLQFSDRAVDLSAVTTMATAPVGDAGANTLTGTSNADALDGKAGNDKIYGMDADDVLTGGSGADLLDGGAGTDTASYGTSAAAVVANLAAASANTGDAAGDTYVGIEGLIGSSFNDTLRGSNGANTLVGGQGADTLYGGLGNDTLYGGLGNDILYGEAGGDALFGKDGADIFVFASASDALVSSRDVIGDFVSGTDKIDLAAIDANSGVSGNQAFSFIGAGEFTGRAGQLHFQNGALSGDINGDRVADFQIDVLHVISLSSTDFYL